jgi:hypothetical protein
MPGNDYNLEFGVYYQFFPFSSLGLELGANFLGAKLWDSLSAETVPYMKVQEYRLGIALGGHTRALNEGDLLITVNLGANYTRMAYEPSFQDVMANQGFDVRKDLASGIGAYGYFYMSYGSWGYADVRAGVSWYRASFQETETHQARDINVLRVFFQAGIGFAFWEA